MLLPAQTFRDRALRAAGPMPALLYSVAFGESAIANSDGVLDLMLVKDAANLYDLKSPANLARKLVAAGKWHDAATLQDCGACVDRTPEIPEGSFLIHEWWDPLLTARGKDDLVARAIDKERRWLRGNAQGQQMALAVRRRDRDQCQYCGIVVRWERVKGDQKSHDLGEYDHVNPFAEVLSALNNLVVACKGCNGPKGQRTPFQWRQDGGRLLLATCTICVEPSWKSKTDPGSVVEIEALIPDADGVIPDPPRVTRDSGPIPDPNRDDSGSTAPDPGSGAELGEDLNEGDGP